MTELTRRRKIHRGFRRLSANAKVRVTCHKKGAADAAFNLIIGVLDLSEAGARLLVAGPLQVGDRIVLGLREPSIPRGLTREGRVVWSYKVTKHDYAVGIHLEECFGGDEIRQVTIPPVELDD